MSAGGGGGGGATTGDGTRAGGVRTIAIFCSAQVVVQLGAFTFPALLPVFFEEWHLSHSEAGWLSGIFFGAYACAVPFLVTLTDRVDARRIYWCAVTVTALSHAGMATVADGFWTGMLFRIMAGVGWAGTYMVGLKALSEQVEGRTQSRAVAAHAASIGVSGSLSFFLAGVVSAAAGWQAAFWVGTAGALAALAVALAAFPPPRTAPAPTTARLLDFRPVFRNRSVMAYSTGYLVHTWEMFVLRSWVVTFLVFTAAEHGTVTLLLVPTVVAMLMEMAGTATTVLGNEVAVRIGRRRWILAVMTLCIVVAVALGFSSALGYAAAAALCLVYNALIYADSASLTAGTVGSAEPGRRGATLAVHAMMGYGGGFVGPLVMGVLLDALGGESVTNWGIAFSHVAVVMLAGPAALLLLRPNPLPGDRG